MSFDMMKKYGELMENLPYEVGSAAQLLIKKDNKVFGTLKGADLGNIKESDVRDMTDLAFPEVKLLFNEKNIGAMVIFKTPYVGTCIDAGKDIPAVLDDMAQIVGHKVKIVDYNSKKLMSALRGMSAVMIREGSAIATGRNLYEAYVAMTVLEKSAEVFLKADILGGAKVINPVEAKIMRLVYLRKYSAGERKAKDELDG